MFRIWAKVLCEEHIEKQTVYESGEKFTYSLRRAGYSNPRIAEIARVQLCEV